MSLVRIGPLEFSPALIIFDKDGTLIDFNFMWASWVTELAARLERAAGTSMARELYAAMGYDAARHRVIAGSPLAAHSMSALRALTARVARAGGLSEDAAVQAAKQAWYVPDPVALARPLGHPARLFSVLRAQGTLIGIATSDDRSATMATLSALGVMGRVNALVSADDGLPNKPAPDMLLSICRELRVPPASSIMVGDSIADMEAGRAAGMGLRVGVLSGVSSRELLTPHADVIVDSIDDLA